jgi:conjugal transfer pilus assembly protein TraV
VSRSLEPRERKRLAVAIRRRSKGRIALAPIDLSEAQAIALWRALCAPREADRADAGLLTGQDMAAFKRALAIKSGQRLICPDNIISIAGARHYWDAACALANAGAPHAPPVNGNRIAAATVLVASLPLAACATLLGGNVKGNFSCSAPSGSCAPSTIIDDSALALIQNARPMTPAARPWSQPPLRGEGKVVAVTGGVSHRERRVLKVVFPAFVDQRGYLHEPRIVHAVADNGGWMQLAAASPILPPATLRNSAPHASTGADTAVDALSESAGSAPQQALTNIGAGSGLPDPAKVAEARARAKALLPTTSEDIRAAVAEKLAKPARLEPSPAVELPSATTGAKSESTNIETSKFPVADKANPQSNSSVLPDPPTVFPGRVEE